MINCLNKYSTVFIILIIFPSLGFCQAFDSLGMRSLGKWDSPFLHNSNGFKYNDVWGYVDQNSREYAIIGHVDSIIILDVTDAPVINKVFAFKGGTRTLWRDFKTFGNHLYAVSDNSSEGLLVFDLSGLPNSVTEISRFQNDFRAAHNIFIDTGSGRLYVAGSNTLNKGLFIYDLTPNPDTPNLLQALDFRVLTGDYSTNFYVHDLFVQGDTAYCSHGYSGLYVWDLSNLNNNTLLGSYNPPGSGYNHSSWISKTGGELVFAEEIPVGRPLSFIDISDISEISLLSDFKDPLLAPHDDRSVPHNPFVKGNFVYSSYYEDGVIVVDISDINAPKLAAFYDTDPDNTVYTGYNNCWGVYPFLPSGKILASDIEHGLFVLEHNPNDVPLIYPDLDGDGYGASGLGELLSANSVPEGFVIQPGDCNDQNGQIHPLGNELCDGIDNNCDSLIDEICPLCSSLEPSLTLDDIPISPGTHQAQQSIESAGMVNNETSVSFVAAEDLILKFGFEVNNNAVFEARIETCQQDDLLPQHHANEKRALNNNVKYFPVIRRSLLKE